MPTRCSTRTGSAGKCSRARTRKKVPRPSPRSASPSTKASERVSEAAPGLPDSQAFATRERAELAASIRDLIDRAMSVEDVDDDTMRDVTRELEQLAFRLGRGRNEGAGYRPRNHGDSLPRSPIVGEASPLSPRLDWEATVEDGRVVVIGHGTFGAPYEGTPGLV